MADFFVECAERETGAPYRILISAPDADVALVLAAESHLASKAVPAHGVVFEDPMKRELRLLRRDMALRVPSTGNLARIIRRSVFLGSLQTMFWVFVAFLILSIILGPFFRQPT
ncbi:MAG: hypothetical protein JSS51_03570 [Planctomycetes bacterium]|nr:hypothetical protein [Planctomycetota bacterium]